MSNKLITIKQSITTYLNWKETTKLTAHKSYRTRLLPFEKYLRENHDLNELNELHGDHIIAYHKWMKTENFSEATISYSGRIIKNYIEFWKGRGKTDISPKEIIPMRYLGKEAVVVDEEDFCIMTDLLAEDFIDQLQKKLAIHLLWDTGMRVSEMTGLQLANINQKGKNGVRSATIRTRKTDRYNLVVWGKKTDELLNKYLGWRVSQNHPSDSLFIPINRKSEKGITTRTVERWVRKLSQDAMIGKKITPHSFRHGKAHHILNNGGTAIDVQAVLRHKNFNSSLNYMRLNEAKYLKRAENYLDTKLDEVSQFNGYSIGELVGNRQFGYNAG
jgi:site-specific recombinase XerD